jgi:gliding motility-associated-like protein
LICAAAERTLNGLSSIGATDFRWFLLPDNANSIANIPVYLPSVSAGTASYVLQVLSSIPGCTDFDTVVVNTFPEISVDAGSDKIIVLFNTIAIGGNPTTSDALSLTWEPAVFLDNANLPNPTTTNTIDVTFTVTGTDGNGCSVSDTVQVKLLPEVKISSGFSPNGDGKNDLWIIDYIDQFPNNTVEIFNRWGEQLFYSQGYETPFNGNFRGKDLPVGTYYYIIKLNHPAYPKPYTGPLTIFR